MNVSLTPELERQVEERVASGLYGSASELVREALRLFLRDDAARSEELMTIGQHIELGLGQLDRGEGIPSPEARRRSRARLADRAAGARHRS